MPPLISYFLQLTLLRASPADAPSSPKILYGCIAVYVISSLMASMNLFPMSHLIVTETCKALVFFMVLRVALRIAGKDQRLVQTATAYYGSAALLQVISLPLMSTVISQIRLIREQIDPEATAQQIDFSGVSPVLALATMVLVIWTIAVLVHILRHAMDISTGKAVFLSLVLWIVTMVMAGSLASLILSMFTTSPTPA